MSGWIGSALTMHRNNVDTICFDSQPPKRQITCTEENAFHWSQNIASIAACNFATLPFRLC